MSVASSTFHEFLHPGDAAPGSATPSSGSNSPEVFFDAADQLTLTGVPLTPIHGGKNEQYHDAPETPASSVSVYIDGCWATQSAGSHEDNTTAVRQPNGSHCHISDAWNEKWEEQGQNFLYTQDKHENGTDKASPQTLAKRRILKNANERGIISDSNAGISASNLSERVEDQKPKARRFLMDVIPQKPTGSSLKEETRKIVQMLSNDKTCRIDRPSLGLQDRLQSLAQRSAGKRTTYVKGPRVCSTLVKLIVKRTQDSLHQGRGSPQGYGNQQEDRPPLPAFNKPIQSYIKPPKQRKVSEGSDRGNQECDTNGFEFIIKRRKKDTDKVPNEKTDSSPSMAVSTSPCSPDNASQVTSHFTTTTTSQVTTQHADLRMDEQTLNKHNGGENIHVSGTVNLHQDTHGSPRQSLINVEFKISVPYRLQDQDTPDCTDHKPSFLHTLENHNDDDDYEDDYDDEDDNGGDCNAPPTHEIEITSELHHNTVSSNPESHEIKRLKIVEATDILQDLQDVTSVNLTNGHTEQNNLSPPASKTKKSSQHSNSVAPGPVPRQRGDSMTNGSIDLQKHIASLNKVSLKFGMKNKEQKSDDKNAVPSDSPVLPQQYSSPHTVQSVAGHTNHKVAKENGECIINSSLPRASGGGGGRFCTATAIENASLPIYKGGEAMLRPLPHTNTSPQRRVSTRDLLYVDEKTQQSSDLPQSVRHIDTLMRLKTDNLVARHGGKKAHLHPYPPSPRQTSPTPDQTSVQDTPENIPTLPPIPPKVIQAPVSRQASKEEPGTVTPPVSQMDMRRSSRKASGHWIRSRNASLEHPSVASRKGSKMPSFSQDMLRKCLMAAVDQCYNTEWEETCENETVKNDNISLEELNKSLVKAISRHDAEKARMVLKLGADPNVKCGNSPALLRATREGALYVLQALLAAGADVDVRTDLGNSPLHLAARGGYSEAIVQLVHSGAFVDAINRSGVTPLQMALAHGHIEVAHTLLRFSADMFLQNKVGETAYDVANALGYIGICGTPQEIRRDSGVGTRVELPSTDIPVAVRMIQGIEIGCAGTVDDCLREGASPNTLLPLALHWPAHASVLHRAAHHGHDLIVRLLLAAGADINVRDVVGNTSLHVAAQAGHNRVVKILLECGAPIEAVSQSGMTPLHRAASKGKELTCNLLTRRGSNRQAEDSSGRTPADWARKRGFKHISQKLMYRRKSSNTLLAEDDERQCLEHLHRLHEAALKASSQSPEPIECEK